ncbi:MAG: DUF3105 domain-containing protein [Chloroflexi bacterium]|nr:DUF3105 domain-containing protein [Chloroflexota bacterium]
MASKQQERRLRAQQRAEARETRRARKRFRRRMLRWVLYTFGGLGGLAIVLSLVLPSSLGNIGGRGGDSTSVTGREVESQGDVLVAPGESHPDYSTVPPTSGWYYDIPPEDIVWGPNEEPFESEVQVAYLRQGGVLVQYSCPNDCPDLVKQLESVVNRYPEGVVLAPYPSMDSTIALTAWRWIDTFEDFDDRRIEDFIQLRIGQGSGSTQ